MFCEICDEHRATHGNLCKDCAKESAPYCKVCMTWAYTIYELERECICKDGPTLPQNYIETK